MGVGGGGGGGGGGHFASLLIADSSGGIQTVYYDISYIILYYWGGGREEGGGNVESETRGPLFSNNASKLTIRKIKETNCLFNWKKFCYDMRAAAASG